MGRMGEGVAGVGTHVSYLNTEAMVVCCVFDSLNVVFAC